MIYTRYRNIINKLSAGFGILDALMGLSIMTTAGVAGLKYVQYEQKNSMVQAVSTQARQVADAVAGYIKTNYQVIENQINTNGGSPVVLSGSTLVSALTSSGFLPTGFSGVNALGESYALGIREYNSPTGPSLNAVLVTVGGQPIPDSYVGEAATLVGAQGGFIPSANFSHAYSLCSSGCAQGVGGSWSLTSGQLSSYGVSAPQLASGSHLAIYLNYSPQSLMGDALYRTNVGNPAGNTMTTNLNMANGSTITGLPQVVVGQPCPSNNAVGVNNNVVVTCSGGTWQQSPTAWGALNPGTGQVQSANGALQMNGNPITSAGPVDSTGSITAAGPVTATNDTALSHGVIWTYYAPQIPCAYGGWCGNLPTGWWPSPGYWWYNTPGYSGCGGNNPSMGVNLPSLQGYQVWQGGSCGGWWRWVPGAP